MLEALGEGVTFLIHDIDSLNELNLKVANLDKVDIQVDDERIHLEKFEEGGLGDTPGTPDGLEPTVEDGMASWVGMGGNPLRFYPPYGDGATSDVLYIPTTQAVKAGRDAMCRFATRFNRTSNASHAGPGVAELRDARQNNHYGLLITSLSSREFCAHYYNPRGTVVSLGTFPFGK